MSVQQVIAYLVEQDPHGNPTVLAERVLARSTKADLLPLVAAEVQAEQRHRVRQVERRAFREVFEQASASTAERRASIAPGLRRLFDTPFALGDGSRVDWLKATADEHRQRIASLAKIRDGLDRTIVQHEEAVRMIEGAGVHCLADLGDDAAALLAA